MIQSASAPATIRIEDGGALERQPAQQRVAREGDHREKGEEGEAHGS